MFCEIVDAKGGREESVHMYALATEVHQAGIRCWSSVSQDFGSHWIDRLAPLEMLGGHGRPEFREPGQKRNLLLRSVFAGTVKCESTCRGPLGTKLI